MLVVVVSEHTARVVNEKAASGLSMFGALATIVYIRSCLGDEVSSAFRTLKTKSGATDAAREAADEIIANAVAQAGLEFYTPGLLGLGLGFTCLAGIYHAVWRYLPPPLGPKRRRPV